MEVMLHRRHQGVQKPHSMRLETSIQGPQADFCDGLCHALHAIAQVLPGLQTHKITDERICRRTSGSCLP